MTLSDKQIEQITGATKAGVKAAFADLKIDPEIHKADHSFIGSWRKRTGQVIKGAMGAFGFMIAGGILWVFKIWITMASTSSMPPMP